MVSFQLKGGNCLSLIFQSHILDISISIILIGPISVSHIFIVTINVLLHVLLLFVQFGSESSLRSQHG